MSGGRKSAQAESFAFGVRRCRGALLAGTALVAAPALLALSLSAAQAGDLINDGGTRVIHGKRVVDDVINENRGRLINDGRLRLCRLLNRSLLHRLRLDRRLLLHRDLLDLGLYRGCLGGLLLHRDLLDRLSLGLRWRGLLLRLWLGWRLLDSLLR